MGFGIFQLVCAFIIFVADVSKNVLTECKKLKKIKYKGIKVFWNTLIKPNMLFHVFYITLSFLGLLSHPFWYSPLLLDIINKFPIYKAVLLSVWRPKLELLATLIFFSVILYIASLIAFIAFQNQFPNNTCSNLFLCWVTVLDQTFKNDGGLGGYLPNVYTVNSNIVKLDFIRIFFDFIYNIVIIVFILQILSGLIINTFNDLKGDFDQAEKDLHNLCTICGMEREEIERDPHTTFKQHILVM